MVIGIFGESCTGKSSIAAALRDKTGGTVYTGKDYLKLAKNEADAKRVFTDLLQGDKTVIYVISEKEDLALLPKDAFRVLVTAELDVIKERFVSRMNGRNLPPPVEAMLERRHGFLDAEPHNLKVEGGKDNIEDICGLILRSV